MSDNNKSGFDNWDNIKPRFDDKNGNPVTIETQLKDLKPVDREAMGIKTDAIVIKDAITGAYFEIEPEEPVEIKDAVTGESFEI